MSQARDKPMPPSSGSAASGSGPVTAGAAPKSSAAASAKARGGLDEKGEVGPGLVPPPGRQPVGGELGGVAAAARPEPQDLKGGSLTLKQVLELTEKTASGITTKGAGCVAYHLLHGPLQQSWNFAKGALLAGGANAKGNRAVMQKLWDYRQWHYESVLEATRIESNARYVPEPERLPTAPVPPPRPGPPLKMWLSAGSTSLTSDIDVNLKGSDTESAVGIFNRKFRETPFDFESGVVYDVNVYALDFMHDKDGAADAAGNLVAPKEGARTDVEAGGISDPAAADQAQFGALVQSTADIKDQEVWSLLKIRMYMDETDWNDYVAKTTPEIDNSSAGATTRSTAARDKKLALFAKVALRLEAYTEQLTTKMLELVAEAGFEDGIDGTAAAGAHAHPAHAMGDVQRVADQAAKPLVESEDGAAAAGENLQMTASNRIYEKKLEAIKALRKNLGQQVRVYEQALATGNQATADKKQKVINQLVTELRDKVSEAALFSNEAYITDGAISHTVVGLQVGTKIKQTSSESRNAVNENVGDSLKEIARHGGTAGEAAFKAGKYMWRMCDAARNMGITSPKIEKLHEHAMFIANNLKGSDGDKQAQEAEAQRRLALPPLSAGTVADIKALVIEIGVFVQTRYESAGTDDRAMGSAVTKPKKEK